MGGKLCNISGGSAITDLGNVEAPERETASFKLQSSEKRQPPNRTRGTRRAGTIAGKIPGAGP